MKAAGTLLILAAAFVLGVPAHYKVKVPEKAMQDIALERLPPKLEQDEEVTYFFDGGEPEGWYREQLLRALEPGPPYATNVISDGHGPWDFDEL